VFAQAEDTPVIAPAGLSVGTKARALELLVPQMFSALTEITPLLNGMGKITLTDGVPCPLLMTAPGGTAHV
jgi:hypothetical protein